VLDRGLKVAPGDTQLLDLKLTICTEAGNYRCSSRVFLTKAQHDTTLQADTTFLKPAIGAAQQAGDTSALIFFTGAAVQRFPNNVSFTKARAGAFELAGSPDSALVYYKKALAVDSHDVATSLQIAKILIDRVVYDTVAARRFREAKDTVALRRLQETFATRVDSARPYLRPGLNAPDSTQRLAAAVIMLTGGSKIAQAQAYPGAYPWLDTLLQVVAPKNPADTLGPKQQVRVNASFWYGLSSVLTLNGPYQDMAKEKVKAQQCPKARAVFDRLARTKGALQLGRRVHPPTADQMLGFVAQYEKSKQSVQRAFKCSPPLN